MQSTSSLETFWIEFPQDDNFVLGIGVTAYSQEDAMNLIKDCGIEKWLEGALETKIIAGVQIGDLDQRNVVPNIGPLQLRGVDFP